MDVAVQKNVNTQSSNYSEQTISKSYALKSAFVCIRKIDKTTSINISQTIWLNKRFGMDWDKDNLFSRYHLSANILSHFVPGSDHKTEKGAMSSINWLLYKSFTEDVIDTMPFEGGIIPFEQVQDWLGRHFNKNEF